ncbi:hypothetical protein PV11_08075 [Exophiala sideris]|uniref:SWI-SNF chromatin-remodeling complex protein n=1 Tax=Exophiala sideris TaxID=1016849 RepID=A0A0D1YHV2_9EURO|nr:hypothetical protein PV11_08075 [Exophiala sideris]
MAGQGPYSFQTNVGRSVTKKWRDAGQISYEGDDWGDDDDYDPDQSAHAPAPTSYQRGPGFQPPALPSNRSVTNPSPSRGGGRLSFDQGDDRRTFSSGTFESPYPQTQRQPFPGQQHDFEPPFPNYNGPAPLRVNTQGQEQMVAGGFRPSSRGRNFSPYENAPGTGPFVQHGRHDSSSRPPPGDPYSRHDSPRRPDSRGSATSSRQFPPRKQSLTHAPPLDFIRPADAPIQSSATDGNSSNDNRPVPAFIRPSDIYKRHTEEMDRVRKSQESSRPSIDTETGRVRGNSIGTRSITSDSNTITHSPVEEPDSARRLKPTALDTVPERKSEYGFDNMLKQEANYSQPENKAANNSPPDPQQAQLTAAGTDVPSISRHGTNTSSIYTDRPDPVSASSVSRSVSLNDGGLENENPSSNRPTFDLPPIDRMSGFGMDLGFLGKEGRGNGTDSNLESDRLQAVQQGDKSGANSLHHQPSLGYRSMVQQAFEESERLAPFSPANSDTVNRSNSTSTVGISPIIDRKQPAASTNLPGDNTQPTIAEETLQPRTRPTSEATLKAHDSPSSRGDASVPAALRVGYRQDVSPSGNDNSPAKRPISVDRSTSIQPQQGSMVNERDEESFESGAPRPTESDTALRSPIERSVEEQTSTTSHASSPPAPPSERTTSEEWQEWQNQKKLFNTKAGLPDSGPVTPHVPSPITRSETPAKGTVRELAGKLETQSGRSTPSNNESQVTSPIIEPQRPAPQQRFESFRPSLPGGWQSYTSTTSAQTPGFGTAGLQQPSGGLLQHLPPFAPPRLDSTDSIPTARAPKDSDTGVAQMAFAAAASAGSALANAFTGHRLGASGQDSPAPSEESSENEWDSSSSDGKPELDDEQTPRENKIDDHQNRSVESPVLDQPSGAEYPSERPSPVTTPGLDKTEPKREASGSSTVDMPAPLRTGRFLDGSGPRPRVVDVSLPQDSPGERDNERLQQEIEKSLTPIAPKRSTFYGDVTAPADDLEDAGEPASSFESTSAAQANPAATPRASSQLAPNASVAPVEQTQTGVPPPGRDQPSSEMQPVQPATSQTMPLSVQEQAAAEMKAPDAAQPKAEESALGMASQAPRDPVAIPAERDGRVPSLSPVESAANTQPVTTTRSEPLSPPTVPFQPSQSTQNVPFMQANQAAPVATPDAGRLDQRPSEAASTSAAESLSTAPGTSAGEPQAKTEAGPDIEHRNFNSLESPVAAAQPRIESQRSEAPEQRPSTRSDAGVAAPPAAPAVQSVSGPQQEPVALPKPPVSETQPSPSNLFPQQRATGPSHPLSTHQGQSASVAGSRSSFPQPPVPMTTSGLGPQPGLGPQQRPVANSSTPATAPVAAIERGPSPQSGLVSPPRQTAQAAPGGPAGQTGAPTGFSLYSNVTEPTTIFTASQPRENTGPASVPLTSERNETDTSSLQTRQPSAGSTSTATRPFIQQRFSWETSSEVPSGVPTPKPSPSPQPRSPPVPQVAPTPRNPSGSMAMSQSPAPSGMTQSHAQGSGYGNVGTQPTMQQQPGISQYASFTAPNNNNQAAEPASLRSIMGLSSPEERIRAYNETRAAYATSDGQLENWLTSLRSPEHSDVFGQDGRVSQDLTDNRAHRTPPRRTLTESAGARQMQEGGKRLMAKTGKFGGKAGTAAKGLFAKGKEKMRQVSSSGEKGSSAIRRTSTPIEPESEDSLSPVQTRESKLDSPPQLPPQLPLTLSPVSPTDWFSAPTLGPQSNDLSKSVQPETTAEPVQPEPRASSITPVKDDEKRSNDDKEEREAHTPTMTAAQNAAAISPAISALDSDQHEHADGPSRSISQITRPTAEHSPVEPPHRTIEDEIADREDSLEQPFIAVSERKKSDANTVTPPRSPVRLSGGLKPEAQIAGGGLNVPDVKRRSIISGVSSASPGPGSEASGDRIERSVSPADEVYSTTEREQREQAQALSTETPPQESARTDVNPPIDELIAPTKETIPGAFPDDDDAPPPDMNELSRTPLDSKPAVETVENVPGDHEQVLQTVDKDEPAQARPFSYAGLEGIGEVHRSQESIDELRQIPTQPLSPVSQTLSNRPLSKEMSQVSVDEVFDQAHAGSKRTSKSYSRPFATDPNVRNHPALRTAQPEQPPMGKAQMYSSESPLPSAKRQQEELDRLRQQREQFQPDQRSYTESARPGDFRIPGPYIQEYRSPKQISVPKAGRSPVQIEASGQPLPSVRRSQNQTVPGFANTTRGDRASYIGGQQQQQDDKPRDQGYEYPPEAQFDMKPEPRPVFQQQEPVAQPQRQSMGPPPLPTPTTPGGRKKSTFGGFFGSKSRTKSQNADAAQPQVEDNTKAQRREKRSSLFGRRTSRQDSISSKRSSQYGDHEQVPPSSTTPVAGRRLSRDLLRGPTAEQKDQPTDGKKKRFSGLSGFFGKSGGSKASALPAVSTQGPNQQQAPSETFLSPQPYSAQTPYGQFSDVPGGFMDMDAGHYPASLYAQSSHSQTQLQRPLSHYGSETFQQEPSSPPPPVPPAPFYSQATTYPDSQPPQDLQRTQSPYRPRTPRTPPRNSTEPRRPADLRIDTSGGSNRNSYNMPVTAPAGGAHNDSRPFNTSTTDIARSGSPAIRSAAPATQTAQPTSKDHVFDLHKRSRSPRLGRRSSDEDVGSQQRRPRDPVSTLGTFNSKKISPTAGIPRGEGDQERPFAIALPGLDEEDERKRRLREKIEGPARSDTPVSVESSAQGAQTHGKNGTGPERDAGLDRNVSVLDPSKREPSPTGRSKARDKSSGFIAELPGSKAAGYESEEEIPMSATAYPGQEWMPVMVGDGRWDD